MKKIALLLCLVIVAPRVLFAQATKSVDKVVTAYMKNTGVIMENRQVKGYFLFFMSDKKDKNTNEYTLQILDQNLNKVKDIVFADSKNVSLAEAKYNQNSMAFLFRN